MMDRDEDGTYVLPLSWNASRLPAGTRRDSRISLPDPIFISNVKSN